MDVSEDITAGDKGELRHDLPALEKRLDNVLQLLRRITDEEKLKELIPIWKRPGWTTPAEFFFVGQSLVAIQDQIRQLDRSIDGLVEGAGLVEGG